MLPTSFPSSVKVGEVIAGRYELVHPLGRGSMGEVWAARHRSLGEVVALKLLIEEPRSGEGEDWPTAVARFLFEAQVAARLSAKTRHIVRVTDHGEEQGLAYLAMEMLEGQTLEKWLMLHGGMRLGDVSDLVAQIARGLEQAHGEGVVHRDLKPGNIFLARDEDGRRLVKLLDFGIARAIHSRQAFASAPGIFYGTPGYMSPEQLGASSRIDHRCDLWALATVAYEALTGELPLPGCHAGELLRSLALRRIVPIHERAPDLPQPLGAFFERAFAENVDERYPSAMGLAYAFDRASVLTKSAASSRSSHTGPGGTVLMRTLLMRVRGSKVAKRPGSRLAPPILRSLSVTAALLVGLLALGAIRRAEHASHTGRRATPAPMTELTASFEGPPATGGTRLPPQTSTERLTLVSDRKAAPAVAPTTETEHALRPAGSPSVASAPTPREPSPRLAGPPDKSGVL
jgi:serine/threonine protein kinase